MVKLSLSCTSSSTRPACRVQGVGEARGEEWGEERGRRRENKRWEERETSGR
jgi:hypothetical protein